FLAFLSPGEIEGVEKSDPTWLTCGKKRYIMALRRIETGKTDGGLACYFLDVPTGHCTIYDSRPILCRLYPFKLEETKDGKFRGFTLHKDVGCPRHRDAVVETKGLHKLYCKDCRHQEDYDDLVRFFNTRRYPGKKPGDFVRLFVEWNSSKG
ncbi:MAG: YkgJ family cysteine cluster protein, partial [Candidatus Hydrogenedentes bacterium]|nr:YkgJ family cysteine cluster protein [Candidatus Hydrogenedentota bacterium]